MYLFVYGILVSPDQVESTLKHPIDREKMSYAVLSGWERAWNVASDKVSHPERTFLLPDGSEFDGVTAALGIGQRGDGWNCDGAVVPVSDADLGFLDPRERSYDRVDVTRSVDWAGKPGDAVVQAYVPRQDVCRRVEDAVADGRPVCRRKAYVEAVHAAFAHIGRLESFDRLTRPSSLPVRELRSVIDPAYST
ncbi:hypothetical protein BLA60_15220 [Actinophytocola xinjiangensis]|uniref:AIG2 family protein n=1 Tax=Actinophytocola xinjiangensis TaxID=485602 RepID=A0A7Z0WQC9_9PSEU|nr:hypothetical protein [Actinophytocola xinjiangensis]OLF10531.1 hypothetical protein BLA60_15220 [Actinophytocola xinjiangensis]